MDTVPPSGLPMTFLSPAEDAAAGLDGLSASAAGCGGCCCVSASLLMVFDSW